jgi:hypothetical protein
MLIQPKYGARLGLNDPLCHVKTTEDLTSIVDGGHERFATEEGKRYEMRREEPLCSHVEERNQSVPQQD